MNNKTETVQLDDQDLQRIEGTVSVSEDQAGQSRYHTVK